VLAGLPLVFWAHFRFVEPTNFGGYDEWLILSLVSRGIVNFPYANRPLALLWSLPTAALGEPTPQRFFVLHAAYSCAAALLVWLLVRRLAPRSPTLAFATAVVTLVWMPGDFLRLNAVQSTMQSGFTAATLAAILLYLESWRRRSLVLLASAVCLGLLAARCYEAVAGLLAGAPLLVYWMERRWSRRLTLWAAGWATGLLVFALLFLRSLLSPEGSVWQTSGLGVDPAPLRVMGRLFQQYGFHLAPLVSWEPADLASGSAALALGVYGLVALAVLRGAPAPEGEETEPRALLALAALGIGWAGLGYSLYVLSPAITTPARTQFLAAPGIALFLSAGFLLLARLAPPHGRKAVVAALVGAVVLMGTGRTLAMQRDWNGWSRFPEQRNLLRQLVAQAPDVRPNTLFVLIDEGKVFPATFTLRHAVEHLYGAQAGGYVWRGDESLYPVTWTREGLACEPMRALRGPWRAPPTFHRFDEVIVLRYADRRLSILDAWPGDLPATPLQASYAPRARILGAAPPHGRRDVLR
jgi:hypothetical protein